MSNMPDDVKVYRNFAGADIVVAINDVIFGELQAITVAARREVAPLHVLGRAGPAGYAKNRRMIMGNLTFLVFDRDALINAIRTSQMFIDQRAYGYTAKANLVPYFGERWWEKEDSELSRPTYTSYEPSPSQWSSYFQLGQNPDMHNVNTLFGRLSPIKILYADQIPPFTVTISMANEYGAAASMAIYGVQIVDEAFGLSIEDLVNEKTVSYVATSIEPIHPMDGTGEEGNTTLSQGESEHIVVAGHPSEGVGEA